MARARRWKPPLMGALILATLTAVAGYAQLGGSAGIMLPYTGHLEVHGAPVEGQASFRVTLWDAPADGNACPGPYTVSTTVVAGAFHVEIGPVAEACIIGRPVYLAVEVDAGEGFVALDGRQRVYPALSAYTSGRGDFIAEKDLVVEGTLLGEDVILSGQLQAKSVKASDTLHVEQEASVTLSGRAPLTVGAESGENLALGSRDLMARTDGSADTLHLNRLGGDIAMGSSSSQVEVKGDLVVSGTLKKADNSPGLVCRSVRSETSVSGDDRRTSAYCADDEMLTGCSCYSSYLNCDGAIPHATDPRRCEAQAGSRGDPVWAYAICCKLQ